nr:hypothetical protein [Bacteroidota bacterium]
MKSSVYVVAILAIMSFAIMSVGCKKTSPANADITVVDSLGRALPGVTVVLRQDSVINPTTNVKADIYDSKVSDINGHTYHSFEWEAVLNVELQKGNKKSKDYITLKQSETVSKTVTLR